jgi:hypothetical protein
MFSLVVAIDCDECHRAFSRANVVSLRFPLEVWQSSINEMKNEAQFQGWYFNETCCLCEECTEEEKHRSREMEDYFDYS